MHVCTLVLENYQEEGLWSTVCQHKITPLPMDVSCRVSSSLLLFQTPRPYPEYTASAVMANNVDHGAQLVADDEVRTGTEVSQARRRCF